jgi:hypothetical protein
MSTDPQPRLIVRLLQLIFNVAFLVPGLDYRFGWSRTLLATVPLWLTLLAQAQPSQPSMKTPVSRSPMGLQHVGK